MFDRLQETIDIEAFYRSDGAKGFRVTLSTAFVIPLLVNFDLMSHIVWVLTPYLSQDAILSIAKKLGHCECVSRGGCDESCIPF